MLLFSYRTSCTKIQYAPNNIKFYCPFLCKIFKRSGFRFLFLKAAPPRRLSNFRLPCYIFHKFYTRLVPSISIKYQLTKLNIRGRAKNKEKITYEILPDKFCEP